MKFDDHFAAFLYENKSLKLEGIGTFTLDDKVRIPAEQEKEIYYPVEGLEFHYNPKSITDENIIKFLVKRLGKIEPLIRSDVEYYLSHIKQFLNIGNPYTIEGIGTLIKTSQGTYEFTPGNFLPVKEQLNPLRENADHNYPVKSKSAAGRIFIIIVLAVFALSVLGAIGYGVFSFIKKQPNPDKITESQQKTDTFLKEFDTIAAKKDSVVMNNNLQQSVPAAAANKADTAADATGYKMIFEITKSKQRVQTRIAQLSNLTTNVLYDSIPINDSVAFYRLFLIMNISAADSIHVQDSLRKVLGARVFMEKVK